MRGAWTGNFPPESYMTNTPPTDQTTIQPKRREGSDGGYTYNSLKGGVLVFGLEGLLCLLCPSLGPYVRPL